MLASEDRSPREIECQRGGNGRRLDWAEQPSAHEPASRPVDTDTILSILIVHRDDTNRESPSRRAARRHLSLLEEWEQSLPAA